MDLLPPELHTRVADAVGVDARTLGRMARTCFALRAASNEASGWRTICEGVRLEFVAARRVRKDADGLASTAGLALARASSLEGWAARACGDEVDVNVDVPGRPNVIVHLPAGACTAKALCMYTMLVVKMAAHDAFVGDVQARTRRSRWVSLGLRRLLTAYTAHGRTERDERRAVLLQYEYRWPGIAPRVQALLIVLCRMELCADVVSALMDGLRAHGAVVVC